MYMCIIPTKHHKASPGFGLGFSAQGSGVLGIGLRESQGFELRVFLGFGVQGLLECFRAFGIRALNRKLYRA